MTMRMRRAICPVLAICALLAAGCGAARPSKYYQLTVPGDMSSSTEPAAYAVTLLLGSLTSSHLYREEHIVYSSAGESMGTYEYQRWSEPPTEMIQEVLFRELRVSGRFREVNALRSNARGDFVLHGHLYDFKEISGNPLLARVAIEYEMRDTKSGNTVWSHYYSHDEPVNGKEVTSVVAALDHNVQGIMAQVRAGLEQYFSAHPPVAATTPQQ